MKNIYLIVAPGGAGKTAITERLEEKYGLKSIQSYTTRPRRYENETGFSFISDEEFDKLTNIVVYTKFTGYRYAVTIEQIKSCDLQIYVVDSYAVNPVELERFCANYNGLESIKIIYVESDFETLIQHMLRKYSAEEKSSKYEIHNVRVNYAYDSEKGYLLDYIDTAKQIFDYIIRCEALGGQNEK